MTATGVGLVADRIIAAAREAGVPVRHDPALAEALAALELGDDVPQALWTAVAETLAWAYLLDAKASGAHEQRRLTATLGVAGRPRTRPPCCALGARR